jgi:hypothetical protein
MKRWSDWSVNICEAFYSKFVQEKMQQRRVLNLRSSVFKSKTLPTILWWPRLAYGNFPVVTNLFRFVACQCLAQPPWYLLGARSIAGVILPLRWLWFFVYVVARSCPNNEYTIHLQSGSDACSPLNPCAESINDRKNWSCSELCLLDYKARYL